MSLLSGLGLFGVLFGLIVFLVACDLRCFGVRCGTGWFASWFGFAGSYFGVVFSCCLIWFTDLLGLILNLVFRVGDLVNLVWCLFVALMFWMICFLVFCAMCLLADFDCLLGLCFNC